MVIYALFLIAGVVIGIILSKGMGGIPPKEIHNLENHLSNINKNDLLSVKIQGASGSLAPLTEELKTLTDNLKTNFKRQGATAGDLSQIAEELHKISSESLITMEQISGSTETTTENSEKQFSMLKSVRDETDGIVETLGNMEQEMSGTVTHTTESIDSTEKIMEATHEVTDQMKSTQEKVMDSAVKVEGIKNYSKDIVKMVELIHNIAKQTNMLALNASVEAARAGESGKGFSVVADEVGKLASETGQVSSNIEEVVGTLVKDILSVEASMGEEKKSVDQSLDLMEKNATEFTQITMGLKETMAKIDHMNQWIQETTRKGKQISKEVEHVTEFSENITAEMQESASQVLLQQDRNRELEQITDKLTKQSDEMLQEVANKVMEGKMLRAVEQIMDEGKDQAMTEGMLQRLLKETDMDVIYITDEKGVVKYCNEEISIGLDLYKADKSYETLKSGKSTYVSTPIKNRVEDGKLYKFLAMMDKDKRIYQGGLSLDSIVNFS